MAGRMKRFALLTKGIRYGLIVGTVVGFIAAPERGEETRTLLKNKSQELKERAEASLEEARTRAEQMARSSAAKFNEISQQGQTVLNEQKIGLLSAYEGVKTGVKNYRESGGQSAKEEPAGSQGWTSTTSIEPAPPSELSTHVEGLNPDI